jgi:quercetin dioxygenase-like cupin family protein
VRDVRSSPPTHLSANEDAHSTIGSSLRIIDLRTTPGVPINEFDAFGATAYHVGSGVGGTHVYVVHLAPGGVIGVHEAGFDQIFAPIHGNGWAAGSDGRRRAVAVGEAALIRRGELHSKGSNTGLVALMLQVHQLDAPGAGA